MLFNADKYFHMYTEKKQVSYTKTDQTYWCLFLNICHMKMCKYYRSIITLCLFLLHCTILQNTMFKLIVAKISMLDIVWVYIDQNTM